MKEKQTGEGHSILREKQVRKRMQVRICTHRLEGMRERVIRTDKRKCEKEGHSQTGEMKRGTLTDWRDRGRVNSG